jgi:hypothetical protein
MEQYEWLNQIDRLIEQYAAAKSRRTYLEHFRQSKLAILAAEAEAKDPERYKSAASREEYARRHNEYLELLSGLQKAVEVEEKCRWNLKQREWKFEAWRSELSFTKAQMPRNGIVT